MEWTVSRESLVQLAINALTMHIQPSMSENDKIRLHNERYFAYMVITYLGKEIAIHGPPSQKEYIHRLMKTVTYEWDENNLVFSSNEITRFNRCLHLTTYEFVWSDELADIVDETFEIRAEINMTPLLDEMTRELIFDIAPSIVRYGNEEQLMHLNAFMEIENVRDRT
jgi:hypothetical protein